MAKRDTYSSGPVSGGKTKNKNMSESPAAAAQVAQAKPDTQPFDLNVAPVKASVTSTAPGTRIELPPGTAIDKVFVSGLNLYLAQPDGSVVVIVGGATNYPTLVLSSGAVVPSEKLEVALEGAQEGVPTAGPDASGPGSSGGDFAVNPGDIGGPFYFSGLLGSVNGPGAGLLALVDDTPPDFLEDEDLEEIITNGLPTIGDPGGVAVEEDDLPLGVNEDGSTGKTIAMGNLGVVFGSDGPGTITFDPGITAPPGLTSQGEQLSYVISRDGTFLTALTAQGREVFTVEIDPTEPGGKYIFRLLEPLDHPPQSEPLENTLNPSFGFIATDANGDTAKGDFTILAKDDVPAVVEGAMNVVDEAEITDTSVIDLSTSVNFGADGPATGGGFGLLDVTEGGTLTPAVFDNDGNALTSDGVPVVFSMFTDNGAESVLTATANGVTVFTLTQTDAGGSTIKLLGPVDHAANQDILEIDVSGLITATDFDGDTITLSDNAAIYKVEDDVPVVVGDTMTATVDEAGAPLIIDDPTISRVDGFGFSVSLSGDFLLVGAPRDRDANGDDFGDAHLIDLTTGNVVHTFDGEDHSRDSFFGGPQFGGDVALEGNLILVGAQFDAQGGPRQGEAHLFDATTGDLIASFDAPRRGANDQFGSDVAISGDLLLIGAQGVAFGGTRAGEAYLFDASNPNDPPITIANPTASREDQFGSAVDIDGNFLVVSAPSNGTSVGEAHLFDASGNFILSFPDPSPDNLDLFGSDVAIQGNLVVVGARNDDTTIQNGGQAYLYSFDATAGTSQLIHTFDDPDPVQNGFFGFSVAIDGNQIVIGAPARDASSGESGRTYVFDATTGDLIQTLEDPTPGSFGGDDMGASVSIDGDTIAVGAPGDPTQGAEVGQVYVFKSGTDSFQATIDLSAKVDFGADGPADNEGFTLNDVTADGTLTPAVLDADGNALKSGGAAVVFSNFTDVNGVQTLSATANGETVFTLSLTGDGEATFRILAELDHNGASELALDVSALVIATDFDGDSVMLPDDLVIFNIENNSDAPNYVSGGASVSDTLTGTSAADIFVIDDLTAIDEVVGYEEQDSIDLSELLEANFNLGSSDPAEFVRLSGTDLEVDVDGGGDSFETAATFDSLGGINTVTIILNDDSGIQTTDAITV